MEEFQVVYYYVTDDNPEGDRICSFQCLNFAEMIRFLYYCKKYNIDFYPRTNDEHTNQTALDKIGTIQLYVDDFDVRFGSDDCIQLIEVYLR